MTYETLFQWSTLLVAPFWGLMIFAPRWEWTKRIIASPWIAAPPAMIFAALTILDLPELLPSLIQPSLDVIMAMFSTPKSALAVWMYFLGFDLFMGRWIYHETQERERSLIWSGVMLTITFMFGPLGFLVYLIDRTFIFQSTRAAA